MVSATDPPHESEPSPLLRLPFEIRLQIYGYILPYSVRSRTHHGLKTVWHRGNTTALATNRQIHSETTDVLYGTNLFEIDVGFGHITFQLRRQLVSGLVPRETPTFPEFFSTRNRIKIRNVLVNVDHVDSYMGMIKYNCGGAGLTIGLKKQVQRVVTLLSSAGADGLSCIHVNMRDWDTNPESGQCVLEPFSALSKLTRDIIVTGDVTPEFARWLKESVKHDI